jgi:hypothetical protein
VVIALVMSCGLVCLPVLAAMGVVKQAGVTLSGPRYTPLDDNMLYVRWDEGRMAALVRAGRSRHDLAATQRFQRWSAHEDPTLVPVWNVASGAPDSVESGPADVIRG